MTKRLLDLGVAGGQVWLLWWGQGASGLLEPQSSTLYPLVPLLGQPVCTLSCRTWA